MAETSGGGEGRPSAVVRELVEAVWNEGRVDLLDRFYTPDCASHEVTPGRPPFRGVEAQRSQVRRLRAAFPDLRIAIQDVVEQGNVVVFRWVARGTQRGEWMGIPPSGRRLTWGGISWCRMSGGRIREEWSAADGLTPIAQLGLIDVSRAQPPAGRTDRLAAVAQLDLVAHGGRQIPEGGVYRYVIEGQVRNASTLSLARVRPMVSLYGHDDRFLASGVGALALSTLEPGQTSPFRVEVCDLLEPARRYEIQFEQHGTTLDARDTSWER